MKMTASEVLKIGNAVSGTFHGTCRVLENPDMVEYSEMIAVRNVGLFRVYWIVDRNFDTDEIGFQDPDRVELVEGDPMITRKQVRASIKVEPVLSVTVICERHGCGESCSFMARTELEAIDKARDHLQEEGFRAVGDSLFCQECSEYRRREILQEVSNG